MCGIAGIVNLNGEAIVTQLLHNMSFFLKNRGPDAEGYWIKDNVGFAHRRLSIIDISESGNQPMFDSEKRVVITYNGEIYNYSVIRKELLKYGFVFNTQSDTEVLLNAYLKWGINGMLNRIDGMFAFALYDIEQNMLYLCRDRFGKKPLYYSNNESFTFSSDIRAVKAIVKNCTIDFKSVDYYLTELSMPQPRTIWNEVKQLLPGHYLTLNVNNGQVKTNTYYKTNYSVKEQIGIDDAIETVELKLKDAILKRKVGDVPIGCFLSGGADSGLIASILALNSSERINTYTVGFTYNNYSELDQARGLAKRYDTAHTEIVIEPNIMDDLQHILSECGEPFADSSIIPSYYISREVSKKVKVVLSGDGGDEVFGGYYNYVWAYNTDKYIERRKSAIARKSSRFFNYLFNKALLTDKNYGHYEAYYKMPPWEKLYRQMGFSQQEKQYLIKGKELIGVHDFTENYLEQIYMAGNHRNITDSMFEASMGTRLLNDYLVKVDRASMMNSLEVRSPFLDTSLVEFTVKLPNDIKLHNGVSKYILKKLGEKYIDKEFSKRPKRGFGIPLKEWLSNEWNSFVKDILLSDSFNERGLFNRAYIETIIKQHEQGIVDNSHKIWALFCLELWFLQSSGK